MDPVTQFQRARERERYQRDRNERARQSHEREDEASQQELAYEIRVGSERGLWAGWGDMQTWLWVVFFILLSGGLAFVCWQVNGSHMMNSWHLGFPPTNPE